MIKPRDPKELAIDLLSRSICNVQVAAVIADKHGIYSWGWNSLGDGSGIHAEAHAVYRASRKRLSKDKSTLYVAAYRKHPGKIVSARPCYMCAAIIACWNLKVMYRNKDGEWEKY